MEVGLPRRVDAGDRDRELRDATLRVIARDGVDGVTIRRVAAELGRSTTAVTHYVADRGELLTRAVDGVLADRRREVEDLVAGGGDALWALIDWSVLAGSDPVWPVLVAAAAADLEPAVTSAVGSFERWWTDRVADLLEERVRPGVATDEAASAVGVVVDGLLLAADARERSPEEGRRLARLLVEPLLVR